MNGPASMPAVEIETLSTVSSCPSCSGTSPREPAAFAFSVKSSPNGVFAVIESNFSLMFASVEPGCRGAGRENVWVKCGLVVARAEDVVDAISFGFSITRNSASANDAPFVRLRPSSCRPAAWRPA